MRQYAWKGTAAGVAGHNATSSTAVNQKREPRPRQNLKAALKAMECAEFVPKFIHRQLYPLGNHSYQSSKRLRKHHNVRGIPSSANQVRGYG